LRTVAGWELEVFPFCIDLNWQKFCLHVYSFLTNFRGAICITITRLSFKPADCFGNLVGVVGSATTGFSDEVDAE